MTPQVAKLLISAGLIVAAVGGAMLLATRTPWLGKLPGDVHLSGKGWSFHFPLATCLAVSALLTLILWLVGWLRR